MRVVGLLVLVLGGCQLVFELEDDSKLDVRGVASGGAATVTTAIAVPRPVGLVTNDLVVAIIRGTPSAPNTLFAPVGWAQLSELSFPCSDGENWRAWVVSGVATDELSFDFTVEKATPSSIISIAYRNATVARFLAQSLPAITDRSTTLPATTATVGSRVMLAGAASAAWQVNPPGGFSLQTGFENLAVYDQLVTQADLPELTFDSPLCSRGAVIAIEP